MSSIEESKPLLVVQGRNLTDGMGDVAHILNAGKALRGFYYPDYEVAYRIQWILRKEDPEEKGFNARRLKQLADKLLELKLIGEIPEDFKREGDVSDEQLIDALNKAGRGRLYIFGTPHFVNYEEFKAKGGHNPFPGAKLCVDVSSNIDFSEGHNISSDSSTPEAQGILDDFGRFRILWSEHNGGDAIQALMYHSMPMGNAHAMGFGPVFEWKEGKVFNGEGLFLEEGLLEKKDGGKAALLAGISDKSFHGFLHGAESITPEAAERVVGETAFVPCYFLRDKPLVLESVVASCGALFAESKLHQVLVKGKFSPDEFFTQSNRDSLIRAGFTDMLYYDPEKKLLQVRKLSDEQPSKVFKVFSSASLSEADNARFVQLGDQLAGCCGDNSLQDAISNGAIPIFHWHFLAKAKGLAALAGILEGHPQKEQWPLCIAFLKLYQTYIKEEDSISRSWDKWAIPEGIRNKYDWQKKEHFRLIKLAKERVFKEMPKHMTPEMLAQWKQVCAYLIKDWNAYDGLRRSVRGALEQLDRPVEPSSSASHLTVGPSLFRAPKPKKPVDADKVKKPRDDGSSCSIS